MLVVFCTIFLIIAALIIIPSGASQNYHLLTEKDVKSPPLPTITSITPAAGIAGTTTNVTVAGTNFRSGATVYLQKTGQTNIFASNVVISNSGKITCTFTIPAAAATGSWDVIVVNSDGTFIVKTNAFSIIKKTSKGDFQ